jgi:ATP/maltotriose-dependent transcriptional regulator MalT
LHALDGRPPRSAGTEARFSAQEITSTLAAVAPVVALAARRSRFCYHPLFAVLLRFRVALYRAG